MATVVVISYIWSECMHMYVKLLKTVLIYQSITLKKLSSMFYMTSLYKYAVSLVTTRNKSRTVQTYLYSVLSMLHCCYVLYVKLQHKI